MSYQLIDTVGATEIERFEAGVIIRQENLDGDGAESVYIPLQLIVKLTEALKDIAKEDSDA